MRKTRTEKDRLFVGQDFRNSDVEIWWRAASSGICFPDDCTMDGSILVTRNGAMNFSFSGQDGTPYLFVMDEKGCRILVTEDSWVEGDETENYEVAWDSGVANVR